MNLQEELALALFYRQIGLYDSKESWNHLQEALILDNSLSLVSY